MNLPFALEPAITLRGKYCRPVKNYPSDNAEGREMSMQHERRKQTMGRLLPSLIGLFLISLCTFSACGGFNRGGPLDGLRISNADRNRAVTAQDLNRLDEMFGGGGTSDSALPPIAPDDSAAVPPEQLPPPTMVVDLETVHEQQSAIANQQSSPLIIKNGDIALIVDDIGASIEQVAEIAVENGGYVLKSNVYKVGSLQAASMVIAVQAEDFEQAMNALRDIAREVTSESSAGEDVTEEFTDLQAQLTHLENTRKRLQGFLDAAQTVDEALKVSRELANIEKQIEQIKGRMQYLKGRAAFSTIKIQLELPSPTPTPTPWSLSPYIQSAGRTQVSVTRWLAQSLTWLVIVPGPYVAGGVIIWLIVRQVLKNRNISGYSALDPDPHTL